MGEFNSLLRKIVTYSFDHKHIHDLIDFFQKDEKTLEHIFKTLHEPTLANLSQLLDIAEKHDKTYRENHGSTSQFFSEVFDTCVSAFAVLLKCLFSVIAVPVSLGVGCLMSFRFENAKFYEPAQHYFSWIAHSALETKQHGKNAGEEYSYLTYDKATQSASVLHSFFSQSPISKAHHTKGQITAEDKMNATASNSFM